MFQAEVVNKIEILFSYKSYNLQDNETQVSKQTTIVILFTYFLAYYFSTANDQLPSTHNLKVFLLSRLFTCGKYLKSATTQNCKVSQLGW
jgi:hypothetical protein